MKLIRIVFISIFICCSINFPVLAQENAKYPIYIIQPGDSLGYVAQLFGTTVDEILSVNVFTDPDLISPGQKINIPGLDGLQGTLSILTTSLGETFDDLLIKYQLNSEQLVKINRISSPTQIFVGSQMIVAVPPENQVLIPVKIVDNSETSLEASVILSENPQSLLLINNQSDSFSSYKHSAIYAYPKENINIVSVFAPVLSEVSISPLPLIQGATEVIRIKSDHPVTLSGMLNGYPLKFFNGAQEDYYAIQGIHALAQPGLTNFEISGILQDGKQFSFSQNILITPGLFDQDPPLTVDPKTIDPSVNKLENELVTNLISQITPIKHWEGLFQSPAVYQYYNSLFGTRRTYNDDPNISFHAGVDFGGGITLPIYSPAAGLVVFAGPLTVRGNTVFIDHGWGIFSGFFHQNKINVKVGDFVSQGQIIGEVGNTGRVNGGDDYYGAGAHLHWEVWANGVQVDPLTWLSTEFP